MAIVIPIEAQDHFSKVFDAVKEAVAEANRVVGNFGGNAGSAFSTMAMQAEAASKSTSALSRAFGDFFKQYTAANLALQGFFKVQQMLGNATDTIKDFQAQQSMLGAILGETTEGISEMTEQAKELGRTTVFTASQVSQLQIELSKLGFEKKAIEDMTESILQFAQATGGDLGDAAALTGAAVRMFGAQTEEANRYTNAMARATTASALNFQAIRDNLATFGPMAHSIGLEIEDVLALFGTLKNAGVEGSTAMTSLRNIFTKVAQGKVPGMEGGIKTLDEFISKLKQIEDMSPGDAMKNIGTRGGTQFMTLLQQADQVLELRDKIKQASAEDTTGEMAEQMTNNVTGAIKMMESAWEGFILSFSESTGPWRDVIDLITKGITETTNLIATGSTIDKEALYAVMTGLGSLITMYGVKNGVMAVTQRLTAAQTAQYFQMAAALEAANSAEAVGYATELKSAVSKGILTEAQAARITSLILENDAIVAKKKTEISLFQTEAEAISQEIAFAEAEYAAASGAEKEMWALWKKDAVMKQGVVTQKIAVAQTQADAAVNAKDAAMKMLNQKSTLGLKAAMDALGLSMLANPYILAAAAIAGVAYVLFELSKTSLEAEERQKMLNDIIDEHNQKLKEEEANERNSIKTIQDKNASLYDQYKAYKELTKARGIFAQYTQEELKNMSQEQIDALYSQDNSERERNLIKNRVEAVKELLALQKQRSIESPFGFKTAEGGYVGEEDFRRMDEKYGLGGEASKWFENRDKWHGEINYLQGLLNDFSAKLEDDTKISVESGLIDGFKGSSSNVQGMVSSMIGSFSRDIAKSTNPSQVIESFTNKVQPSLDAAIQKSRELNKELVYATGDKKTKIKAELDQTNADIEVLRSLLDFFRLGNEKEVVIEIKRKQENVSVGKEALMDIGSGYEELQKKVDGYLASITEAKDKVREMGDTSPQAIQEIAKEFGLTNSAVEANLGQMESEVSEKLSSMQDAYKNMKDGVEKNRLKVKIDRYEELLGNIRKIKTRMLDAVKNPFDLIVNIKSKLPGWLATLLGKAGVHFGGDKSSQKIGSTMRQSIEDGVDAAANKKAEEDAKKDASEKASKEAAQRRKQQKEYETLMDKQKRERERAAKDMEFSTRQAEIKAMEDGSEKTLAQIQLDFEKQEEAIQRGYEDLRLKKIEQARQLFEKNPANKGKEFDVSSVDTSYTEAEQMNRDAQRKENEVKRKKAIEDVNKDELKAMNDYLKEYGSMEQKRLAIAQEYAQKIKDAKTEGERLSLQKELQEKQGALSFENIAKEIDWGAVFGGIENMTTEMMQRLYNQLKAFERTDEYRKADADTKQRVADMIAEFRQFVGNTDQSDNITKMGDAVQKFNEAILKYKEATENDKIAREEYEKATSEYKISLANKESYDKKLASGEITQEIYDELAPTAEELNELGERAKQASEKFSETGATAAQAKENVKSLGIAAREAADDVRGWVSKGVQDAKNSFLGKKDVMGFSNLAQAFESFDNFKGALDAGMNEGQLTGAMNSAAQVISNDIIPVVDSVGDGIMGAFSEGFLGAVTMYAKVAQMILQMSDQVKEFVTGILDSFTEVFKFEWLEDLVVSITSSISNLVDAIFDLPENLYKALESIVTKGVGNMFSSVLGRVGNVLSFGALSSKGVSSWFSNEDKTARTIQALTERNEKLQGAIENLTDEMEKSRGAEAIRVSREAEGLQKELNNNILQKAIAQAQYHSAHHSFNYYWDGYTQEEQKRLSNQIGRNWNGDIFDLSPEEMRKLRSNADMWDKILNTGKGGYGGRVAEYLNEYIDQAGKLEEITDKLNQTLTSTTKENVFDDYLSSLYEFADGVDDVTDNVAEKWRSMVNKMVIDNVIGNSFQKEMEDWYSRLAKLNERYYKGEITERQYKEALDEMESEYNQKLAKGQEQIKRLTDAGIIQSKSDNAKDQSATANMADKATYDQFELYLGIATAQQIALEQGNSVRDTILASLSSLQNATDARGLVVNEIRSLAQIRNEYLLDIKKSNREMLDSFGQKMDDMYNLIEDRL